MPFLTRRSLEELLAAEAEKTEKRVRKQLAAVNEHATAVGRRNTELCAKVTELEDSVARAETYAANLRAQLDLCTGRTIDIPEPEAVDPEQLIAEVQALSKARGKR